MVFQNNDSINMFFSLLRSGLYGTPLPESELPDKINWNPIVKLAQKHCVFGTFINGVRLMPERLQPSAPSLARMNKFALGLIQTNLILDKTLAQLVRFLKQHDINGVVLKGQGVARYYRMPQMRQSGDIDFYVGKTAYKKAVDVCKKNLIKDTDRHHETDQHFDFYTKEGILIELHRIASRIYSPTRNKQFQNWVEEELEHSPNRRILTVDNTDITLPSYDFDAIYIFYHAWRHYITGGIGLRQLCDWAMIFHTHSSDIDTGRLVENINRFGMTKAWKLFACIVVNHLGVSPDKMPLYDPAYSEKSEKILEEIIEGGNFGYYSEEYLKNKGHLYGLRYGLRKFRSITGSFLFLLPLLPLEAIFLYGNHLYFGTIDWSKRTLRKLKNKS